MGYFMRYFAASSDNLNLVGIEAALKGLDAGYQIIPDASVEDFGELRFENMLIARIEINRPGDEIFEDDLDEFRDLVGAPSSPDEQHVLLSLNQTQTLIALEIFWESTNSEPVFARVDPLWQWFFAHHPGVLQADGEGFYDQTGLIVERNFTL